MSIISTFDDNQKAWEAFKKSRRENPEKELYVYHTSKEESIVQEKYFARARAN